MIGSDILEFKKWYKLDNMGKFYASIIDSHSQNIFRFSATIRDDIDQTILQKALDITIQCYPNFNVNLKKGIFWYYLEQTNKKYIVQKENSPICFKLYTNSNDFLYRVSYYKKRINFEVSHIISDGIGSSYFFKSLISNYVKLRYSLNNIEIYNNSYIQSEEDSFSKYYNTKLKKKNKVIDSDKLYYYKGHKSKNITRYFEMHLSVDDVLNIAHKHNTTLTILIISILIYSMKDCMSEKDLEKNIKIDVPVDLRNYFKSASTKNYFGLISIIYKFNNRNDTLDMIIEEVSNQFKTKLTKDNLCVRVNQMIAFEKNAFCRLVPIFIKNIVLKTIDFFTSKMCTSCVSNIGIIKFDNKISNYIENINILTSTINFQFTLCSFKKDLSIGISSKYKYNEIIENFCTFFSNSNIDVVINVSEVE